MPTVIVTGGGGGGTSQGESSWIEKLLPIAVIGVIGFIVYKLWSSQQAGAATEDQGGVLGGGYYGGGGSTTQQAQQDYQQQQLEQQNQRLQEQLAQQDQTVQQVQKQLQQGQLVKQQALPGNATLKQIINTPGNYMDTSTGKAGKGTGLGGLFVTAGPSTPTDYYPLGNVVTTSRDLSTAEQATTLRNLANSGIKDAWWVGPAPVEKTAKGETLSQGYTSQVTKPAGKAHCVCTAALRQQGICGANDDWYYC